MAFRIKASERMRAYASEIEADVEIDSQPIIDGENIKKQNGNRLCVKLQGLYLSDPSLMIKLTAVGSVDVFLFPGSSTQFVCLHDRGLIVGYLKLIKDEQIPSVKWQVNESFIKESHRSKGYGVLMYAQAIKRFKGLCSSANMGSMAVRTWKSLAKKFNIHLWCTTFDKEFKFDWGTNNIPVVQGKPIDTLHREEFVFYAK